MPGHAIAAIMALALAAALLPGQGAAQGTDASDLSAAELEAIFQKQKTRGLVLVQPQAPPEAGGTQPRAAAASTVAATAE
ncbi:hypothetical protein ICN82_19790, partial [Mangrovicoccus sp. HB182678]|nr:hypothetical protein [Mangrovicoccus algicola]